METNSNIVVMTKADLLEVMTEMVKNQANSIAGERKNTEPVELEPYLTREDVCRLLKVSPTTLWRWNQKGVLNNFKVGARSVLYLRSEVESFIRKGRFNG